VPGGSRRAGPSAPSTPGSPPSDSVDRAALVGTALDFRGVQYRDGGSDPGGFDCSGFTQYVFAQHGIQLPREVREQYRIGRDIDVAGLAAGDLLFFSTTAPGPSHVAIAVGEGDEFVHAPSSSGVVRVERLSSSYWSRRFIGARRLW
jgi:cell wall-associated NlpC family hydrolase